MPETFHSFEEYRQRFFPEECERERGEKLTVEECVREWAKKRYVEVFGKECDD